MQMTVRPIVVLGNPLRNPARKVTRFDDAIRTLVQDMIETMRDAPGGRAGGPQVGAAPGRCRRRGGRVHVLVNPEIVTAEGEHVLDEGCLPVLGLLGSVTRAEKVTVKALDTHGEEIRSRRPKGYSGRRFQHEIDHLNGMVYVDRFDSLTSFSAPPAPLQAPRPTSPLSPERDLPIGVRVHR